MKATRLVQITDIHLESEPGSKLYGVDTGANLERVVNAIANLSPPPEAIIATGDLTEDASRATYLRLREMLLSSGLPVYVLAGNHDNIEEMRLSLVGGDIEFKAMQAFGDWVLMFVNTQVAGQSFGLIDAQEMSRLEANLKNIEDKSVLLAVHHSPMPICSSPNCQLKNAKQMPQS